MVMPRRPLHRRLILTGIVCLALGAAAAWWSAIRLTAIFEAREQDTSSRLLGRAYPLRPGTPGTPRELIARLDRLGYRSDRGREAGTGTYVTWHDTVEAGLRGFHDLSGDHEAQRVRVTFGDGSIAESSAPEAALEPETIAVFQGPNLEEREIIGIEDCPKSLLDAILAAEDRRFFLHPGIDPGGVARAVWTDLTSGSLAQGGSTLTQQLAKNLYTGGERTFSRKAAEAFAAVVLEINYSKQRILRAYLNEVYLGQRGAASVNGFGSAARHYFGKNVRDLSLPESALLAGMIRAPGLYNPWLHRDRARERRDAVLRAMVETGSITEEQRKSAEREAVRVIRPKTAVPAGRAPYIAEQVRGDLEQAYGADFWKLGLRVHTSIDPIYQEAAEQAVSTRLQQLERSNRSLRTGRDLPPIQAALISMDLADGSIVAMVGGRDFGASQFNRATSARRQPGSLFKPIVYLAGLTAPPPDGTARPRPEPGKERLPDEMLVGFDAGAAILHVEPARREGSRPDAGASGEPAPRKRRRFHWWWQKPDPSEAPEPPDQDDRPEAPGDASASDVPSLPLTAATILMDEPYEVRAGGKTWAPHNDDETFRGPVTVQRALEESLNVPTARAAAAIGLPRIVETGHSLGIRSDLPAVPSIALGSAEVTPLEMAIAFATVASGGIRREPAIIAGVEERDGRPSKRLPAREASAAAGVRAIEPTSASLMTALLEGVVDRGTGRSARDLGFSGVAAGKTGTSDDGRDLWFCGYTPRVLTLVWVGLDDNRPTHLTGARGALPVWVDYMKRIGADAHVPFSGDAALVWADIDPTTGGLARRRCPDERLAPFIPGTEPVEKCREHRSFWSRWFD